MFTTHSWYKKTKNIYTHIQYIYKQFIAYGENMIFIGYFANL